LHDSAYTADGGPRLTSSWRGFAKIENNLATSHARSSWSERLGVEWNTGDGSRRIRLSFAVDTTERTDPRAKKSSRLWNDDGTDRRDRQRR